MGMLKKFIGFTCLALSIFFLSPLAFAASTDKTAYVATAQELQKALDNKKIEHIVITDDITGNFKIYRWLRSIRGQRSGFFSRNKKVKIQPKDAEKPTFETEFELYFLTPPPIEISNLEISCPGVGIASHFTRRTWILRYCDFTSDGEIGCAFSGSNDPIEGDHCLFKNLVKGIYGGTGTLKNSTFEKIICACIENAYKYQIEDCHFSDCGTALGFEESCGSANSIVRSTVGDRGVGSWCQENCPLDDSDSQSVTIDAQTLNACRAFSIRGAPEEDFEKALLGTVKKKFRAACDNCIKNARQDDQFTKRNKDYEDSFRLSAKNKDFAWTCQYTRNEWDKYQQMADKEGLEHLLVLYRQIVQLPILLISDLQELRKFADGILTKVVPDIYLCRNMVDLFILGDEQEPAMPFAISPYIKLANTSSTLDLLVTNTEDSPQKILRGSLDSYIEWTQLVKKYKTAMEQIKEQVRHLDGVDIDYAAAVQRSVMKSNEIFENVSRVTRALYFDLPTQAFFCRQYARTFKAGKGQNAIARIVRDCVPFYKIYIKLCVLPSTNTLYQKYLLKKWKKVLKEENFESLKALTATDPDMMSDNRRVEDFLRDYQ